MLPVATMTYLSGVRAGAIFGLGGFTLIARSIDAKDGVARVRSEGIFGGRGAFGHGAPIATVGQAFRGGVDGSRAVRERLTQKKGDAVGR